MTHEEILRVLGQTSPDEWHEVPMASDAPFLHQVGVWTSGDKWGLDIEAHYSRAAWKQDVSLGLAWGLRAQEDFTEEWTEGFPDSRASSHFVDALWNGSLVDRWQRVSVDGGRCGLPVPHRDIDQSNPRSTVITAHWITDWEYRYFGLLQGMSGTTYSFDEYLSRAGIEVR